MIDDAAGLGLVVVGWERLSGECAGPLIDEKMLDERGTFVVESWKKADPPLREG